LRDLGEYAGSCGRKIRRGRLFRGDDLHHATDSDLQRLAQIPLHTIIDFRDEQEKIMAPDRLPDNVRNYHGIEVKVGNILDIMNVEDGDASKLMVDVNISLSRDFQKEYREFFRIAADDTTGTLFFHCSAGKDRTGFAAALLLSALGVEWEVIMADYRRSSHYIRPKYEAFIERNPILAPFLESHPKYLEAAFETINYEFGGIDNYLVSYLDADVEKLRYLYLEQI
jgi:protein-tyrosine phosphatase